MLKDEILKARGIDLPISGGDGSSLEEAIIIHFTTELDIYTVENIVQNYLFEQYCVSRQGIRQELLSKDGRVYDRFQTFCEYKPSRPPEVDLSSLCFDITESWNRMYSEAGNGKKHNQNKP
jgi:hypothetical protein